MERFDLEGVHSGDEWATRHTNAVNSRLGG